MTNEGELTGKDLRRLMELDRSATDAPWHSEETALTWTLHGGGGGFLQILKAPKDSRGLFADYWPTKPDGMLIVELRNLLPKIVRTVARLRDLEATCTCGGSAPMDYEGPQPDCAVHGAVRGLQEAQREIEALRTALRAMEAWMESKPRLSPADYHLAEDHGWVDDGFGNRWSRCKKACELEVVRPGQAQCRCEAGE
jgi:hypothetical protein